MSSKSATNRRWTSSDRFRQNYDRIFAKVCDASCPHHNSAQAMLLHLDAITNAGNQHRLAKYKQLCTVLDCKGCEERLASVRNDCIIRTLLCSHGECAAPVQVSPFPGEMNAQTIKPGPTGGIDEVPVG